MSPSDLATVIYSYVFVTGAIGTVLWFVFKKAIHHIIEEGYQDIKQIKAEVTPNHGSSLNDKIKLEIIPMLKELRASQLTIGNSVAKLEGKFEQHIEEHNRN